MNKLSRLLFIFLLLSYPVTAQIDHRLDVTIKPEQYHIKVNDQIKISAGYSRSEVHFLLHANLEVDNISGPASLIKSDLKPTAADFGIPQHSWREPKNIPVTHYILKFDDQWSEDIMINLTYSGKIHHEIEQQAQEYARSFSETPGIIDSLGVYLAGSSFWIPWFDDDLLTFDLTANHPAEWETVSQGKRADHQSGSVRWICGSPTEEIYLIAASFKTYEKQVGAVNVMAFLRSADPALANKYLETTGQYLEMYRQLIGPYPYSKFALIENFWETGYGMPSFTLLGSKVIRFPFILHSSYPHELLHNWWGNGVYVDYSGGNWCEGLTAFMADHLIKEQRGQGAEYRRTALQAYSDYVNPDNEFALSKFRSRTDASSSAIGYNKSMMIFNMLRDKIGDDVFIRSIQKFYRDNKYKRAGFDEIRSSIESATDTSWGAYFDQWVEKPGAPEILLKQSEVQKTTKAFNLNFMLQQVQEGEAYDLAIPVAVVLEGKEDPVVFNVYLNQAKQQFTKQFTQRPLRLEIDPQFEVFRRLDRNEIPPSLSHIFGTEQVLIVLPSTEDDRMQQAYRKLADKWSDDDTKQISVIRDNEITELPSGKSIWLFGHNNLFFPLIHEAMSGYGTSVERNQIRFGRTVVEFEGSSVVSVIRHPQDVNETLVWLRAGMPEAMPGLGRKLPHYGKYGYLAFEGDEPTNIVKGQWAAVNSPMRIDLVQSDKIHEVQYKQRKPLADLAPVFSEENISQHINHLSDTKLEGRGFGSAGLDLAAEYIAGQFKMLGLQPGGDNNTYYQSWQEQGGPDNKLTVLKNVIGIIPGDNKNWRDQSVIICAHYDHLGLGWPDVRQDNAGAVHPGADDNASGVAVMLELARILADKRPARTIIFAAFTAEEAGLRGSKYYVKNNQKQIIGALNLDTVGRLFNKKILIIGSSSANEWKHIAMGVGFVTGIPNEIVSQELDASDQVSFIEAGIPAIQLFSGAHSDYHRPGDTTEKLDFPGIIKVATFAKEILNYLANERKDPMTFTGQKGEMAKAPEKTGQEQRRAATGIMPDFAFKESGVKVAAVSDGSAADQAGLKIGDVIIALGGTYVTDLRSYANLLRKYKPGDTVTLKYKRDQETVEVEITLGSR
jgi:hypothetical protein